MSLAVTLQQEPEYFSDECGYNPLSCSADSQRKYILEASAPWLY